MMKRTLAAGLLAGGLAAAFVPATAHAVDMPLPSPSGDWTASDMLQEGTGAFFGATGESIAPMVPKAPALALPQLDKLAETVQINNR